MTFIRLFFLALISGSAVAQTSYVAPTRLLKKQGYQLSVGGDAFFSSKRADEDSKVSDFAEGESFRRYQAEANSLYGLTDQLQMGLGVRYRINQATMIDSFNNEYNSTGMGIQSTSANIMYAFKPVDQLQYTVEATYRYTPYTNPINSTNREEMILGEEGNELSAGLGVTYNFQSNDFLTGRIGYRRPGNDISDEIYWQLEGALSWRYVSVVAGVDGVTSLNRDPYIDAPNLKPDVNLGNTFLYYGINREWITPYAGFNVAFGKDWRVDLRAAQVVQGQSTDLGTAFGIQIVRRTEKMRPNLVDSKFKSYDLEASVTKVSPEKNYVVLDKGMTSGIQKGISFDLFEFDYLGGNILVARGIVINAKSETSVVKITQRYNKKKEIKEGLVGRASIK